VSLLDLLLKVIDLLFLLLELGNQVVQLLLEKLVLLNTVEVINSDSGDFVRIVLNINFLLGNGLVDLLRLLQKIG
jgi:hypothetical protein